MKRVKISIMLWTVSLMAFSWPLSGETISFKFSYNTASISGGDINTWIDSYNARWKDWQTYWQGQLDGQLNTLKYGPKYEVELRIPIIFGLAINLSGSHFSSSSEGTVTFIHSTKNQTETDYLNNEIKGIPIKIGFSYSYPLPFLENLQIYAGIGRHITFLKYNVLEDYELNISDSIYTLSKDNSYNSQALGVYINFGLEYDLIQYIAVVVEAEKVWSKADGFKGPFETDLYDPFANERTIESGKASLYFYENQESWNNKYYSFLAGHDHNHKPDDPEEYPNVRNLRQGELDLSTFSIKIGIRFKF
jgi:hypothetical protein